MNITINNEQKLFVIKNDYGVTCQGFTNVYEDLIQVKKKLGLNAPLDSEIGTIEQYSEYQATMKVLREKGGLKTTFYKYRTPKKVQSILEGYRKSEEKIRIFYGDYESGRDWLEEYDTVGRVSRSGGLLKVPILVADDECGGPALLDHCIVKLQDVTTGKVLWQHKNYQQPKFHIQEVSEFAHGLTHEVLVNEKVHARFSSLAKAAHWVAFMSGETSCCPN
ncbi:hypothetical protein THIAE_06065 [Thiomicrospira aerophila AL3]|uniref:Uncharacterized protein n=1 Tax=Thiomicrospira aerophila AL3 TaxID=717772 RepID=W0DVT0_9GAMM|nr:hypothetical protein [Thiomicrospira aerophila]AHF01393.1 hypothetical protein THIAE_06065 [Thiomicrospira aerophila AL3]